MTDPGRPSPTGAFEGRLLGMVLVVVSLLSVAVHTLSLMASRLWVYPDSIDYIILASGIADHGGFSDDLFLIRPPGYPLLLAGFFVLFEDASGFALLSFQHLLSAATALLTAGIGWTVTRRASIACVAGVLCALGLQGLAYANLVLTETTYSFLFAFTLFALVRYLRYGRWGWLAVGSGLAGAAYLVKPIGAYLLGVCILALVLRTRREGFAPPGERRLEPRINSRRGVVVRRLVTAGLASVLPAAVVAAPWKIAAATVHASDDTNRCLDYVLYLRALEFDGLDDPDSAALREIKRTVDQAIAEGAVPVEADFRDRATVIDAYEAVHDMPFAGSSAVMGQAARDVMWEHATTVGFNTIKYAAWMLLAPDPVYRFQPGGAPGVRGKRDRHATIYDVGTYAFGPGSWEPTLAAYRHYLPLDSQPRSASRAWADLATVFHKRMDAAPPVLGIADSPYSEWIVFCLIGLSLTLLTRDRSCWFLLIGALGAHVLISGFLGGPQTRYGLPVQPILKLGGAWFLIEIGRCAMLSIRSILPVFARPVSGTNAL